MTTVSTDNQVPIEPVREKVFTIEHTDARGQTSRLVFKWARPTIRDLVRIAAEVHRVTEGQDLKGMAQDFAYMLAYCRVVLKETPKGFSWDEVDEGDLLARIFVEARTLEDRWFRRGEDVAPRRSEGPGAGAPSDP
jgi:hypothetical protein